MTGQFLCDDSLNAMKNMADNSVDAIVTDPPYGISFMGKNWDHGVPGKAYWEEALRVAKPGAYLLAFGGTRTHHRLMVEIEDAGWEIRDCIMWVYGQGFPKSLNVSKAFDRDAGAVREVVGTRKLTGTARIKGGQGGVTSGRAEEFYENAEELRTELEITIPATPEAKKWNGWGTALKPAWEPVIVARKPLEGSVIENIRKHGTGAINIDECRIPMGDEYDPTKTQRQQSSSGAIEGAFGAAALIGKEIPTYNEQGRFPANLCHDGSKEVVDLFPETGVSAGGRAGHEAAFSGGFKQDYYGDAKPGFGDKGSAARFFYCAKPTAKDRSSYNSHPTVKPTDLMRWLIKLVTPKGGTVLDPFMGSGTTGKAAKLEKMSFIGIDKTPEYVEIAKRRFDETDVPVDLEDL